MAVSRDEKTARARREQWWRYTLLVLATVYVALLLIRFLVGVLGGFAQILLIVFMAWLLAFVLAPVVSWLHGRGVPRGVAIGSVYAATLVGGAFLLFYAVGAVAGSMTELAEDMPQTHQRIEASLRDWEQAIAFGRFRIPFVELYRDVEATGLRLITSAMGEVPEVTLAIIGALVLVVVLSLYMLADSARIVAKVQRVVPARYRDEFEILERNVSRAFGGFLRAQVLLALIQALLAIAVIVLLGLPYGFLIGAASTLAMLIPFFGPPLALIPPLLATAIFEPEWLIVVAPLLFAAQTVLVNYLQPRLMRDALGMHPLLVLVGLVVGAQVAGVWGALFGIPVLAVANVFFNYVVNLRTIEESGDDTEDVLEEMRRESPEAAHEELVALAADRIEDAEEADGADAADPRLAPEPPKTA